jgi:hypothetical protein
MVKNAIEIFQENYATQVMADLDGMSVEGAPSSSFCAGRIEYPQKLGRHTFSELST